MIFKRRERPSFWFRAREFVYPRKGFWRGFGYIGKRMRRLPDTPHRIALGFACGAFASFTPLFTLHFILAGILAWAVRGNIIAALFGTIVGNPLTFPMIASSALWLGRTILGRSSGGSDFEAVMAAFGAGIDALGDNVAAWFGYEPPLIDGFMLFLDDVFLPYCVGGIVMGSVAGFVSYWIVGPLIAAYQTRRQRKLNAKAAANRKAIDEEQAAYGAGDGDAGDNL